MNTGVRQGCFLSPLLFLVALDCVSRQAFGDNKTGIQFTLLQKLEDLELAVDMVLLSQKITHMRQKFAALLGQAARVGLKVNAPKTKEMIEDSVPSKYWQHQSCRRDPGASIDPQIPWQPYHHHRRH